MCGNGPAPNIGNTRAHEIAVGVRAALDDARYWVDNATYPAPEIAVRLHHRLLLIHPFVNGNGRSTRLLADVIVKRLKAYPLTWGSTSLVETGEARQAYAAALRAADASASHRVCISVNTGPPCHRPSIRSAGPAPICWDRAGPNRG
jgi:fido (protein-threonine AMPylation protein)